MAKSNADRQKAYRNAKRNAQRPESLRNAPIVTERNAQPDLYPRAADVRASHAYTPRANPDKLNWGLWMSSEQLAQAGSRGMEIMMHSVRKTRGGEPPKGLGQYQNPSPNLKYIFSPFNA